MRNGVIKVTAAGGTPSYSMWISPNYQTTMHIEQQNKVSFTNLASGTYTINLMDTHGCTSTSGGVVNPPPSIQIFSDKAKGSPKEEIKFDFHLTNPSNIKPDYYALEIKMGNKWLDLQDLSTTDMSASFVPKTLGNLTFRLSFSYTDNNNISYEVLSDEINYEVGYCDNEFISDYGTKMNDCWNNMLSATEANKQKNEYGFAVQYKGLSGDISTDDRSNSVDCNTLIITLEGYSIATNPSASSMRCLRPD